jgi:hypothetical protein
MVGGIELEQVILILSMTVLYVFEKKVRLLLLGIVIPSSFPARWSLNGRLGRKSSPVGGRSNVVPSDLSGQYYCFNVHGLVLPTLHSSYFVFYILHETY